MCKSKLLGTVAFAALTLATTNSAMASDPDAGYQLKRWYATGFIGWTVPNDDHQFDFVSNATGAHFAYRAPLDNGFTYGGAVGLIVNRNVRAEVELSHSNFDFTNTYRSQGFTGQNPTGDIDSTTLMANVWFNTHVGQLMPYIGGGIGVAWTDGRLRVTNGAGLQFDGSDTSLALQVGGGLRIPVGSNIEFDLGYRLKSIQDVNFKSAIVGFSTTDDTLVFHTFQAGLTFKF